MGIFGRSAHSLVHLTPLQFFTILNQSSTPSSPASSSSPRSFLYYSGEIHEAFDKLLDDIAPLDGFRVKEAPKAQHSTFVWIGGSNVTAHTHYDPTHNCMPLPLSLMFILHPYSS
jgi:hypothetical protein